MTGSQDALPAKAGSKKRRPRQIPIWLIVVVVCGGLTYSAWVGMRLSLERLDAIQAGMATRGPAASGDEELLEVRESPAAPIFADGHVITNPRWSVLPRPIYPEEALRRDQEGSATLLCRASPLGELADCVVVEEAPAGLGFGEAAVRSADRAQLHARAIDGVGTAGFVRFTVRFTSPPE